MMCFIVVGQVFMVLVYIVKADCEASTSVI